MNCSPEPAAPPSPFLLFFRGPDWDRGRTREETEQIMEKVAAWFDGLQRRGAVLGGAPLAREGMRVTGSGRTVSDGPFAESKEVVGGYLVLAAKSLADAAAAARECPTLDFGIDIEVRPMLSECPIAKRLRESALQPA
jgi:hypothetical protein